MLPMMFPASLSSNHRSYEYFHYFLAFAGRKPKIYFYHFCDSRCITRETLHEGLTNCDTIYACWSADMVICGRDTSIVIFPRS